MILHAFLIKLDDTIIYGNDEPRQRFMRPIHFDGTSQTINFESPVPGLAEEKVFRIPMQKVSTILHGILLGPIMNSITVVLTNEATVENGGEFDFKQVLFGVKSNIEELRGNCFYQLIDHETSRQLEVFSRTAFVFTPSTSRDSGEISSTDDEQCARTRPMASRSTANASTSTNTDNNTVNSATNTD